MSVHHEYTEFAKLTADRSQPDMHSDSRAVQLNTLFQSDTNPVRIHLATGQFGSKNGQAFHTGFIKELVFTV